MLLVAIEVLVEEQCLAKPIFSDIAIADLEVFVKF